MSLGRTCLARTRLSTSSPEPAGHDAPVAVTIPGHNTAATTLLAEFDELDIVKDDIGAMHAYEQIRHGLGAGKPEVREDVRRQLLRYCQLDTAAMVMIWKHWLG